MRGPSPVLLLLLAGCSTESIVYGDGEPPMLDARLAGCEAVAVGEVDTTVREWDDRGRLIRYTRSIDSQPVEDWSLDWSGTDEVRLGTGSLVDPEVFTLDGRLSLDVDGRVVEEVYDAFFVDGAELFAGAYLAEYRYLNDGRPDEVTYTVGGESSTLVYEWDGLVASSPGNGGDRTWTHGDSGELLEYRSPSSEGAPSTFSWTYAADAPWQVETTALPAGATIAYTWTCP